MGDAIIREKGAMKPASCVECMNEREKIAQRRLRLGKKGEES
jgi:hypothetical protein